MKDRTSLTVVCLHISAVLYVLVAVFLLLLPRLMATSEAFSRGIAIALAGFALALAAGVEVVVVGLRRRKFWAWIAGLIICGTYASSLFLPLGALGLWGLLAGGSRKAFGVGVPAVSGADKSAGVEGGIPPEVQSRGTQPAAPPPDH